MLTDLLTPQSHPKLFHGRRCAHCGETPRLYWKGEGFLCPCKRPHQWWKYLVELVDELKRQEYMRDEWTSEVATLREEVTALTQIVLQLQQRRGSKRSAK